MKIRCCHCQQVFTSDDDLDSRKPIECKFCGKHLMLDTTTDPFNDALRSHRLFPAFIAAIAIMLVSDLLASTVFLNVYLDIQGYSIRLIWPAFIIMLIPVCLILFMISREVDIGEPSPFRSYPAIEKKSE